MEQYPSPRKKRGLASLLLERSAESRPPPSLEQLARQGDFEAIRHVLLLRKSLRWRWSFRKDEKVPILHHLLKNQPPLDIVELVLASRRAHGDCSFRSVDMDGEEQQTALHVACQYNCNIEVVKCLIKDSQSKFHNPVILLDRQQRTPLHCLCAALIGDIENRTTDKDYQNILQVCRCLVDTYPEAVRQVDCRGHVPMDFLLGHPQQHTELQSILTQTVRALEDRATTVPDENNAIPCQEIHCAANDTVDLSSVGFDDDDALLPLDETEATTVMNISNSSINEAATVTSHDASSLRQQSTVWRSNRCCVREAGAKLFSSSSSSCPSSSKHSCTTGTVSSRSAHNLEDATIAADAPTKNHTQTPVLVQHSVLYFL